MIPKQVSDSGLNLVMKFEGLHKLQDDGMVASYRCPAGKWTIGYGHTKGVRSGMKASVSDCQAFLKADLEEAGVAVKRLVNVPLSQSQYDALVSFVFNLGEGNFKSSTLLKVLNQGKYGEVPGQIIRWNKARVKGELTELKGLTRRRAAEAALFTMDEPLSSEEGGDLMVQKPEVATPKPLAKSKTMAGAGMAGVGTLGSMIGDAASQLQSLVSYSSTIKTVFVILTVVGIALVTYARMKDSKDGVK